MVTAISVLALSKLQYSLDNGLSLGPDFSRTGRTLHRLVAASAILLTVNVTWFHTVIGMVCFETKLTFSISVVVY